MLFPQFEIPCVILCGGKSSRMGEDKALLPFDSKNSLTQYQYDRLKPFFKKIYLSSKTDKFDFEANLIFDKESLHSPIVALKSIFETLKNENKIFIITVDTPFVTICSIRELINNSFNNDITIAKTEKTHNLCGVFDKTCLPFINEMLSANTHKVGYLLKNVKTKMIQFHDDNEFLNLNDKEEYKKATLDISQANNYN